MTSPNKLAVVNNMMWRNKSMLSDHDTTSIRKQKFIGTRKHHSEGVAKTSHEHVAKDSDGSTNDASIKNIHGTTTHTTGGDEGSIVGDVASKKRRGDMNSVIESRSYRDVLINGGKQQKMTRGQHTCDDMSIARKENKLQLVSDF